MRGETGVKVCIVYGTRRGSTEAVARAMAEAIKGLAEVEVFSVAENPALDDCDLVVIGAPIYYERPVPEVMEFIRSKNGLKGKDVALFILSIAEKFGKLGKAYTERRYMILMKRPVKGRIVATKAFEGWLFETNAETLRNAQKWIREVVSTYRK